ncbi:MAG: hypothetical protein N3H31_01630 [Candidatus Nezhaarchaeota archaeon]|nr:hypothetical protein [Candidatus Nezhaarchaeota archaeon]
MKLYIAACGLGLGHASRCLALAEEAKREGHEVVFSTYSGEAALFIRSRGFEVYETPSLSYKLSKEGDVDFRLTLAKGPLEVRKLPIQIALELKYLRLAKPDVALSDSRLSTIIAANILGIPSALLINQLKVIIPRRRPIKGPTLSLKSSIERLGCELLGRVWGLASKIFIPDFPPPLTISRATLEVPERLRGKVKLVGPLLSRELLQLTEGLSKRDAKLKLGASSPLVVASIGGLREEKVKLLRAMMRGLGHVDGLRVIASFSLPDHKELILRRGGLEVHSWLPNYWSLLAAADVCINHGGHTSIAEAIYAATPMVLAPLRGHTERYSNSKSMERLGIARVVDLEDEGPEGLREAVLKVLEDPSYAKRAAAAAKLARRFYTAREVVSEVVKLA